MPRRVGIGLVLVASAVVTADARAGSTFSQPWEEPSDDYPLDDVGRIVPPKGQLRCAETRLVRWAGGKIRYDRPVRIDPAFRARLEAFEAVVMETATEIYGRAPRKMRHLGTFACRRIRSYPTYLSEHALGNAIDIEGFDFGPAPRKSGTALPQPLRRAFRVSVLEHWNPNSDTVHARFLLTLAKKLVGRSDVFRVLLGPGYPGHRNHFHFDMGPYRMVEI